MRVIFTDIDGVLNPHWRKKWSKSAVILYNKICKEFDLRVVITSTWRTNHTIEQLQQIFTEQGIEIPIYDYTPHLGQEDRGLEIRQWLIENVDCIDWVIIDDKTSDIEPHVRNVVKCRSWIGLTKDEYEEIKTLIE
jgi:hypothetical protein